MLIDVASTLLITRKKTTSHIKLTAIFIPGSQNDPNNARSKAVVAASGPTTALYDLQVSFQKAPTLPSRRGPAAPRLPAAVHCRGRAAHAARRGRTCPGYRPG